MASEEQIQLFNELTTRGCCRRCILRYLGISKSLISFDYPNTSLINFGLVSPMEEFELGPASKVKKINPCCACLGVLEDPIIDEMLSHEDLAKVCQYKHKTFVSYVTFPTCVLLRDHSLKVHLKKKYSFFNASEVMKISNVWRYSIKERLCKTLKKKYAHMSKLTVHFYMDYSLENDEMALVQDSIKSAPLSKHQVAAFLDSVEDEHFSKLVNVPPREPFYGVQLKEMKFYSEFVHLMGNYCKYSRNLPQVPIKEGEVIIEPYTIETIISSAVQGVASDFKEIIFKASNFDHQESRVLGQGRTFQLQIVDPKFETLTRQQCAEIEAKIRESEVMEVKNLHEADKRDIALALDSETLSPCSYKILCIVYQCKNIDHCVNAVNMHNTIVVSQKTPIRLMTRRTWKKMKKKIYYIRAKKCRDNLLEVDLCVQNGFHVPEFVNGDFNRTVPSLGDIMRAKVEFLAFDVVDFQSTLPCAAEEEEVDI